MTQEQLEAVTQMIRAGLQEQMQTILQPMFTEMGKYVEGRTVYTTDAKRNITETLSKRIESFKNSDFESWQFKLITATRAISDLGFQVLEQGRTQGDSPVPDDWAFANKLLEDVNREMYYVLTEKTEGEALTLVRSVPMQNGAEAWRRLLARFDAHTIGREILLARRVVSPAKVKHPRDFPSEVDKWEVNVRKLKTEYDCDIHENLLKAILIEMLPKDMLEGVMARMEKGTSFQNLKKMILTYAETRLDFGGQAPMQVDNLEWNDDFDEKYTDEVEKEEVNAMNFSKGKGKGKWGQTKGFSGTCNHCGEWGHKASTCPRRLECWNCGGSGHRAADCPKGSGKGKGGKGQGEGQAWQQGHKGNKGKGKNFWTKGNGKNSYNFGKGPTYAVYGETDYTEWKSDGDQALSLFGLADPSAHDRHAVPGKPRITTSANLLDFVKVKPSKTHRPKKIKEKNDKINFFQNQFEILQEDEQMEADLGSGGSVCPSWTASPCIPSYDIEGPPGIPIQSSPARSTRRQQKNKSKVNFCKVNTNMKEEPCQCCSPMCLLEVDSEEMATNIEQMEEDPGMDIDAVKEADEEGKWAEKVSQ